MVPNSDWFDPCDGILLAEARIIATEDCFMVERFVGRGFEEEKPVRKVPVSTEKTMKEAICKFYINSGGKCPLGDACDFYHPPLGQIPVIRKGWLAERLEKRLKNATQDWPDPIEMSLKQPHSARASVFADWILQEFGELDLNSGSGVYDIAGGSGKLSLELIDRGIEKCTVVDSRDFSMGFAMKRWIKKRQTSSRTAGPDEFSDREADSDDEEIEHELLVETSESPRMGNRGQPVGELNLPFIYRQQFFTPDKITPDMHYASLFVGLHPDQATGAIVEVAIQLNKSFAVIPCCVFKDDFNERKLRNGKQVCTTLELIEWIKEKRPDGEVGTCFLDFQGKNLVVYNKMKG
ncbi:hypothetical protein BC830DRAFT_1109273 [Chytriomyces sp. MP71]|nr:hypothetical protein BC830DRAFT_1109273 [Chytriomyces sp. MP71]